MQRWTAIGLALVLLGGMRIGYAQLLGRANAGEPSRIDARYAGLKIALRQISWDQPIFLETGERDELAIQGRSAQASYSLSPRMLLPDRGAPGLVVLDLPRADLAAALIQGGPLKLLWRSSDGLVILARRAAP